MITHEQLSTLSTVGLSSPPVAVAFLPEPPAGLPRVSRPDAASCGYWQQASQGHAFYTMPDDHTNCPVGAFTHGVPLSSEKT